METFLPLIFNNLAEMYGAVPKLGQVLIQPWTGISSSNFLKKECRSWVRSTIVMDLDSVHKGTCCYYSAAQTP
jgi:hypothetical protein